MPLSWPCYLHCKGISNSPFFLSPSYLHLYKNEVVRSEKPEEGIERAKFRNKVYLKKTSFYQLLEFQLHVQFTSVQFSRWVVSDFLWTHESQHARPPCPSPAPRVTVSIVSPSICNEVMGPDAMTLIFWMLSFKPTLSQVTLLFHFHQEAL